MLKYSIALLVLFSLSLLAWMFYEAHRHTVVKHTLWMNSSGPTLFFISDIHKRKVSQTIIKELEQMAVDAVVIGGDSVEAGVSMEKFNLNLRRLSAIGPTFIVTGNNDYEVNQEQFKRNIDENHVILLQNEVRPMPGFPNWAIAGIPDPASQATDLPQTLQKASDFQHCVLVSHQPKFAEQALQLPQTRLVLTGHTHGGQIRFWKWGIHPRGCWTETKNGVHLVSNGYGTTKIPLRLGAPAETHLITIKKENEHGTI